MSTEAPLTGKFGPFEILEHVGSGGMAAVYKAKHPELGTVALKVLHRHLVKKPEILHRFWREMRLAEKLDHRNIVRNREAGVEGDRFFVAMDFIDGVDLYKFERKHGALDPADAIQMMMQILDGLHHAHENGIIHRDLKPENIMLDAAGNARVSDFGIAKHLEATVALTQTGTAMGTPYYMAPEQIRNAKKVGPEADVYSAGILLYEMVTAQVPYYAKDPMEVIQNHINGVPVAPGALNSKVSRELENVILKAMEKKPEDRFRSALFMKKALELVVAGERTGIKLVSPVNRPNDGMGPVAWAGLLVVGVLSAAYVQDPTIADRIIARVTGKAPAAAVQAPPRAAPLPGAGPASPAPVPPPGAPAPPPPAKLPSDLPGLIAGDHWAAARDKVMTGGDPDSSIASLWRTRIRDHLSAGLTDAHALIAARNGIDAYLEAYPATAAGAFLAGEVALQEGNQSLAAEQISEGFRRTDPDALDHQFDHYRPVLQELTLNARRVLERNLHQLAELRVKAGAPDEALELLRQSSKIHETPGTHRAIARLYDRLEPPKAVWHRKRARALESER